MLLDHCCVDIAIQEHTVVIVVSPNSIARTHQELFHPTNVEVLVVAALTTVSQLLETLRNANGIAHR